MIVAEATAPGKIILFGEHAVVYGRPAIAAPISQLRAKAHVYYSSSNNCYLIAPDLQRHDRLDDLPMDDALATAVRQLVAAAGLEQAPDVTIHVRSDIPIASGMGSGAAIAAAIIRALAKHLNRLDLQENSVVSALTYEVEKIHHGTPSGIDNSVVAYERPICFVRQSPQNSIEPFSVTTPLRFLVADSGIRSSTKTVVEDVRRQWRADPTTFDHIFDQCGRIAQAARTAIETGDVAQVGALMTENHKWLQEMMVSSSELDKLVTAALQAGALGAKLSGAGRGGNIIALVKGDIEETAVRAALKTVGATTVLTTVLTSP
ncbi:Mevalonate kinase [hydrothermal vent metagenome]|uniref:Mevalonate kinase n=1 Tax=hydrothermal vent metagenome TaxID=652676 RepID=A0A3B0V705_9ZZZZ